jgi:ArsR family transcriptional regulator, lead/cadmium/zinc/bismuth-responsive transcriptional repressor
MHLVPPDRAGRRIIDEDRVCDAIASLGDPGRLETWARRFALLGDPTRLRILTCIDAAEPISVSDLAVAVDLQSDTVSQTLRLLRATDAVSTERDGRVIRYRIADPLLRGALRSVAETDPGPVSGRLSRPSRRPGRGGRPR